MTSEQGLQLRKRVDDLTEALSDPSRAIECVMLLVDLVRDLRPLLDVVAQQRAQLDECHALLSRITESTRPLGGGVQQEAAHILTRHGLTATWPSTASRAG
jgi:hypothetical protein